MNKRVLFIALGFALLVVVGILASQVGGIAIRRTANQGDEIRLSVAQPLLPGVETVVRYNAPSGVPNSDVVVKGRTAQGEATIGEGRFAERSITVVFPCDMAGKEGSISLWDVRTSQLLASQEVKILDAGPDCFR